MEVEKDYDVFVEKETGKKEVNEGRKKKVPADYLPVKLPTAGKLNAPYVLHVKDYSGEDALSLSLMNEENILDTITEVADNVIYEGIDSDYLHEQELEVIMLHIYYNYWGSVITDYPYPYTEDEVKVLSEEKQIDIQKGLYVPRTDIPIKKIVTNPLPDEFKEPFTLTDSRGKKVTFTLSRVGHLKTAQRYIENKFAQEEQKFGYIKQLMSEETISTVLKEIPSSEIREYNTYLEKRSKDFAKIQQCQVINKVGSKKCSTLEDKLKVYNEIGLHTWKMYSDFVKTLNFGVDPKVEVISPFTGETVERRFQFRFLDFIPAVESPDDSGYTVSYEDE